MSELEARFLENRRSADEARWQELVAGGAAKVQDVGGGKVGILSLGGPPDLTLPAEGRTPLTSQPPTPPRPPAAAPAPEQPSAVGAGAGAGATAAVEGGSGIVDGLRKLIVPAPAEMEGGPGTPARAAKQVFDGLMRLGLSPFIAAGAGARQKLENENPELAKQPVATGAAAMGIRGLLSGKAFKDLPPAEQQAMMQPMTVGEALELGVQFALPVLGPKGVAAAVKKAKTLPAAHRAAMAKTQEAMVGAGIGGVTEGGPPIPPGHTRLYRGEQTPGSGPSTAPGWAQEGAKASGQADAFGRWFSPRRDVAMDRAADAPSGRMVYMDVPTERVAEWNAGKHPTAARFASQPDDVFVPREALSGVQPLPAAGGAAPPTPAGAAAPGAPGLQPRVNLGRIDANESVKRVIADVDIRAQQTGAIDAATRGKRTHEETIAAAGKLKMTVGDVLARQPGEVWNAEQQTAARDTRSAAALYADFMMDRWRKGEPVDPGDVKVATNLTMLLNTVDVGQGSELARAMEARKIGSDVARKEQVVIDALMELGELQSSLGMGEMDMSLLFEKLKGKRQREQVSREAMTGFKLGINIAVEAWMNGLVSGMAQVKSFIGGATNLVGAVPTRVLAAMNSPFIKDADITLTETGYLARGMAVSTLEAMRVAGEAFRLDRERLGRSAMEERTKYLTAEKVLPRFGLEPDRWYGRGLDMFGDLFRLPGRGLMSGDQFNRWVGYRAQQHALSYRKAREIHDVTGLPVEDAYAKILADQLPEIVGPSKVFADEMATMYEPGPFGKALLATREEHPQLKFLVTFYSISAGTWRWMGQHTPILGRLWTSVGDDFKAGGNRKAMALARMELGGIILAGGGFLALNGLSHGKGSENPETRKALGDKRPPPYTIGPLPGDVYVPMYLLGQHGLLLGMAADYVEVTKDLPDDQRMQMAIGVLLAFNRSWSQQTFLKDTAETIEAVIDADTSTGKLDNLIKRYARSALPLSAAIAGIEREMDPAQREAMGALDALRAKVPWLSSSLAASRNVFGEISYGPGALWTSVKDDPVVTEMKKNDVNVSIASATLLGGKEQMVAHTADDIVKAGIPLLGHERMFLVELAGQGKATLPNGKEIKLSDKTLRESLVGIMNSKTYQSLPYGAGRAEIIVKEIHARQEAARNALISASPPLKTLMYDKLRERAKARTAVPDVGPGMQIR